MEFKQILELIDHVSASELTAFTYETADLTLSMEHGKPQVIQTVGLETVDNVSGQMISGGKFRKMIQAAPVQIPSSPAVSVTDAASEAVSERSASDEISETQESSPQAEFTGVSAEKSESQTGNVVTSPLVGTFYAAPSQDLPPYVQVGDKVKKGQVLAIVEAMKLMNEIESDFDGEIVEIYVENGQPVEYGQKLFRIR